MHGNDDVLLQLLARGLDESVNQLDRNGMTPLMVAAKLGWRRCVRVLLTLCRQTKVTLTDSAERTARDFATAEGHWKTAEDIDRYSGASDRASFRQKRPGEERLG